MEVGLEKIIRHVMSKCKKKKKNLFTLNVYVIDFNNIYENNNLGLRINKWVSNASNVYPPFVLYLQLGLMIFFRV